ncbi:hemicentin-1 [Biomphalaria glabrata]|nr:hemicentin-1 [Biomphalaria glabrata]
MSVTAMTFDTSRSSKRTQLDQNVPSDHKSLCRCKSVSLAVVLLLVLLVSGHVSRVESQELLDPDLHGASLAFVFDITGSMYDDLVQVIKGAGEILHDALSRREKPLHNYVLVPFHDPGQFSCFWLILFPSVQVSLAVSAHFIP